MKEIKFRGKRLDNGEWVVGYLVVDESGETYIVNNYGTSYSWDEVDPETVGQYTGVQDEKQAGLYQHDLWECAGVAYIVSWHPDEARFYFKHPNAFAGDDDHIDMGWSMHGVKVGNIHDNPDLLEATHE